MKLNWSGLWGVFCRLEFNNQWYLTDSTKVFEVKIQVTELTHNNSLSIVINKSDKDLEESIKNQVEADTWTDLMIGVVDVRNISVDQESQHCPKKFEHLRSSINIKATINEKCMYPQIERLVFAYLWPLEDQGSRLSYSESVPLIHLKGNEATVKLQIMKDVTTIRTNNS